MPVPPAAPIDERTGMEASRFGVYVHFPWCLSKCPYCDFASVVSARIPQKEYARALARELDARLASSALRGRALHSVFIGGGTPSLMEPVVVARLLERLASVFQLSAGAEITLEANPGASDEAWFQEYRAAGVNRLSLGIQSFQPELLRTLGRSHDVATAERAFAAARRAGFDNLSLDLIYGVHGQTLAQARADAARAAVLQPEHVSAYALTLDRESLAQEVPLARQLARGEVALPPAETVVEMRHAMAEEWAPSALERYEVSNYARAGFHSRHNALYWTGGEYLALGAGATGRIGPLRYANHRSAERYFACLEEGRLPTESEEPLEAEDLWTERVAMGLRLTSGVDLAAVARDFGRPLPPRAAIVDRLCREGLAQRHDGRLRLTSRGLDVHSAIAAAIL
jgi:putative oxygen-independent coproporphyrinogen III oxidase